MIPCLALNRRSKIKQYIWNFAILQVINLNKLLLSCICACVAFVSIGAAAGKEYQILIFFYFFFRLSNFWWIKRTLMAISTMKNSFAQWWTVNAKLFTRNSMHPPLSNFFIRTKLIKAKWSLVLHQIKGPKSIN